MNYTVDEVSVELGIPRPTVYRYLKEYSIPYSRRSGRIFVPQESVGKIGQARELLEGGYGTEAVRSRLRQGGDTELSRVTERLDKLVQVLETSKDGDKRPAGPVPDAHALRMILARQTLLISAVSNLAEMTGDLMAANGLQRRHIVDYPQGHHATELSPRLDRRQAWLTQAPRRQSLAPPAPPPDALPSNISHDKFGTLARRRRAALATFAVTVASVATLLWQLL